MPGGSTQLVELMRGHLHWTGASPLPLSLPLCFPFPLPLPLPHALLEGVKGGEGGVVHKALVQVALLGAEREGGEGVRGGRIAREGGRREEGVAPAGRRGSRGSGGSPP